MFNGECTVADHRLPDLLKESYLQTNPKTEKDKKKCRAQYYIHLPILRR